MQMRRYTSLRSNIVRRHQLPFRLMPLPYRRWGRGLDKFARAVALKVRIAAGFVTSKVAALATFGCRGRRRVAYSSERHDPSSPARSHYRDRSQEASRALIEAKLKGLPLKPRQV